VAAVAFAVEGRVVMAAVAAVTIGRLYSRARRSPLFFIFR
jgi:hypothetical protein